MLSAPTPPVALTGVGHVVHGVGGDLVALHVHLLDQGGVGVVDGDKPPAGSTQ